METYLRKAKGCMILIINQSSLKKKTLASSITKVGGFGNMWLLNQYSLCQQEFQWRTCINVSSWHLLTYKDLHLASYIAEFSRINWLLKSIWSWWGFTDQYLIQFNYKFDCNQISNLNFSESIYEAISFASMTMIVTFLSGQQTSTCFACGCKSTFPARDRDPIGMSGKTLSGAQSHMATSGGASDACFLWLTEKYIYIHKNPIKTTPPPPSLAPGERI